MNTWVTQVLTPEGGLILPGGGRNYPTGRDDAEGIDNLRDCEFANLVSLYPSYPLIMIISRAVMV